jgi:hypothetical protein
MVRARLATLTLAGSLLLTASGCMNLSERFQAWRHGRNATVDCTCHDIEGVHGGMHGAVMPGAMQSAGPVLVAPEATFTPPPPTATGPIGQPPRITPIPATPMPWTGQQ